MGRSVTLRARGRGLKAAALAVTGLLVAGVALAHETQWVFDEEAGLNSADANESAAAKPTQTNLCEGVNGIPTGGDPGWARTSGSPNHNASPFVEASGQVLPDLNFKTNPFVTHTDAPFNHYSKDVNVFLTLDKADRHLLGSGNFVEGAHNEHGHLEIEWERGGIPIFAFPAQSDRMTIWGEHVWDCGHGGPNRYRTEIHPPVGWVSYRNTAAKSDHDQTPPAGKRTQDPWQWYEATDHQGIATTLPSTPLGNTPVQATVADAFFSSFGGNTPESLNGCDDSTAISDDTTDAPCLSDFGDDFEWAQPLLKQDYEFFVPAPPKPSDGALMVWEAEERCGEVPHSPGNPPHDDVDDVGEADDGAENIGAPSCAIPHEVSSTVENGQEGIKVKVKANSGGVSYPSNNYLAFAKRYKVAWDETPASSQRPRVFSVAFDHLKVFDDSEEQGNDGEWVVSLTANEQWIHPVRGHGDDDAPFWEDGAIDDGCDDDDSCTYAIGDTLHGLGILPGEPLHVKLRGWEDDEGFITGNQNFADVLTAVNVFHPLSDLPGTFVGTPTVSVAGLGEDGAEWGGDYRLLYRVLETTPSWPTLGTLTIGDPTYGPNDDTGGTTRISAATPITYAGTDGVALQYKVWKDGASKPAAWVTDNAAPFELAFPGDATDGRYTIEYRPVSAADIVGETRSTRVERDTTPPALDVPADIEVLQTETAGAYVSFVFSASDNLPGPVAASCDKESGSLFPGGKNAPEVTTVTCTATDAVGNQTVKTFNVTVRSPFGYVNDFVVLATEWAMIDTQARVQSGNVGVFDASPGIPNTGGIEVAVAPGAVLSGGPQIAAHSVSLAQDVVAGDVFRVDQLVAAPSATYNERVGYVPLFAYGMPAFPSFSAGGPNENIKGVGTLAPGDYGEVVLGPKSVVTLTGGDYRMESLELQPGARLYAGGASRLLVTGRVLVGNTSTMAPAPGSGLTARDLVVYSSAVDGPPKKPADAIQIGSQASTALNAYAPNGTVSLGSFSDGSGAFVGKRVRIAASAVIQRDSVFLSP